jgi:hypothetical protein
MSGRHQGSKRTLAKKVTSFNMYLDQATQIQAIMEATGADKDAPVLRTLLDEALSARRRRAAGFDESEPNGFSQAVEMLQALILKAITIGERSLRIDGFNLRLLQETFAEAHGVRQLVWTNMIAPTLQGEGMTPDLIANRFDLLSLENKASAYEMARSLMQGNGKRLGSELTSGAVSRDNDAIDLDVDDNQPMLF